MNLLDYANLANAAYSAVPTVGVENSSARAVVHDTPDGCSVGFPGTNNIASLLTDIDALTHDAGALGFVHRGTYMALESIWEGLSKHSPSVIYGHSLGGMLAILYAARLCADGRPPKAVYAFEPAHVSVGDRLKDVFRWSSVNVIITRNGNDIIPIIPEVPFEDWKHCAEVLSIGSDLLPIPNIHDHLMANVIESIKAHLANPKNERKLST